MRPLHPATHQGLPPTTPTSPSTLQGIKDQPSSTPKQQMAHNKYNTRPYKKRGLTPRFHLPTRIMTSSHLNPSSLLRPHPLYPHRLSLQHQNPKKITFYSYLNHPTLSLITPTSTMMSPSQSPATWSATSIVHKRKTSSKLTTNYPLSPSPPQTFLPITLRNMLPGGMLEGEPQQERLRN